MATQFDALAHKTIKTFRSSRLGTREVDILGLSQKEISILWAFRHQTLHPIKVQWAFKEAGQWNTD